jgi:hypothetical protein
VVSHFDSGEPSAIENLPLARETVQWFAIRLAAVEIFHGCLAIQNMPNRVGVLSFFWRNSPSFCAEV